MALPGARAPSLPSLLREVRGCVLCAEFLVDGVRPVLQAASSARILIAGQAPGRRVHESGVPFDDPSGERLRDWLGLTSGAFYDAAKVAIVPMAFCYPGTGKSGDLPPRPECAHAWRRSLLARLPALELTVVIGRYAIDWHLKDAKKTLTETVRAWKEYGPDHLPLPHPSPRNNLWLKKNPWFESEVIPHLRERVTKAIA